MDSIILHIHLTSALFQFYKRYHSEPLHISPNGSLYKVPTPVWPFCFVTSQNCKKMTLQILSITYASTCGGVLGKNL